MHKLYFELCFFLGSTIIWRITLFIWFTWPSGISRGAGLHPGESTERDPSWLQCTQQRTPIPIFMISGPSTAEWAGWAGWLGWAGLEGPLPSLGHLWVSLRNLFQLACATPSRMFWLHFQALAWKQQLQELVLMRISLLSEANIARNSRP